jgi:hypothetical protein
MAEYDKYDKDILETTVAAGIPGALFGAIADVIKEAYPLSPRKAQLTAIKVLEQMTAFYERVAAGEAE